MEEHSDVLKKMGDSPHQARRSQAEKGRTCRDSWWWRSGRLGWKRQGQLWKESAIWEAHRRDRGYEGKYGKDATSLP